MTIDKSMMSSAPPGVGHATVGPGPVPRPFQQASFPESSRWREQRAPWWLAGVYCSAPALFLWIAARLPAEMLADLFRGHTMPQVLNQLGDALFFCGWAVSGILFLTARRRARNGS